MTKILELKLNKGDEAVTQTLTGFNPEIKGISIYKDLNSDFGKQGFDCLLHINVNYISEKNVKTKAITCESMQTDSINIEADFKRLDHKIVTSIEVTMNNCSFAECECRLIVRQGGKLINVENPLKSFAEHINDDSNTKIVLSGKFGQGKTTFLNHFFEKHNEYDVFTVYPVNYSVATNEDIFKYIKTDILFQLLGKGVEFDVSKMTYGQALQEFLLVRPKFVIANVIKAGLKLNKATSHLVGAFEQLEKIHNEIVKCQIEETSDSKKSALELISTVFEEEGSIYDDNFYTQLIRQLLEKVKAQSSNKKTVLVIEDLDRMDPDHIFRILNVVSAHYDTYMHSADLSNHNKFGFDKIILVCDIDNIRNIFHHKYGEHTDFDGYFNKYFSSAPFRYDNNAMVESTIKGILFGEDVGKNRLQKDALIKLIGLLVVNNQLQLRELIKMKNLPFEQFFESYSKINSWNNAIYDNLYFIVIAYLKNCLGDSLANRISKISKSTDDGLSYNRQCDFLIGGKAGRERNASIEVKGRYYDVVIDSDIDYRFKVARKYTIDGKDQNMDFTLEDFKKLLIELCEDVI